MSIERELVGRWLDAYVTAWKSYDREGITALFSGDVVYRYRPHGDEISGRDAVVDSWLDDDRDDSGTYDAEYRVAAIDGDLAVCVGTSTYLTEPGGAVDKVYDNCFLVRFDAAGRCAEFTEWFMERPQSA